MEILIAVAFLAVCASAIVEGVWTANMQASYAQRRALIVNALQDRIETVRAWAISSSLSTLAIPLTTTTVQGVSVSFTTTYTPESNSLTLWDVTVTATWTEERNSGTRADSASLSTVVKD